MRDNGNGSSLPPSWSKAPIDELGVWFGGGTPSKAEPKYWTNGTIPWVSPKDMKVDRIVKSEDAITTAALSASAVELVPRSSILMVVRSGILRHSFPVATNSVEVTLNQDMKALKPHDPIDADYIRYALTYLEGTILHSCSKDGTTVQSIQTAALKQIEVPVAPAQEQRRIVAKIDELFSDIEEGERCLARAEALLKQYRQSVLKAAVTGELTRDWRAKNKGKGETGADLLRRILAARREAWEKVPRGKAYVEPESSIAPDLPSLPEEWAWSSIGQLFDVQVGATPSRKEDAYWNGDVPWVSSGEVAFCRIAKTREQITKKAVAESSARLLPKGTVLLAMIGEGKTRGQPAILDIEACNSQNSAAIIVSRTPVLPEFLYYVLCERYEETRREGKGGNQPALNSHRVRAIPVPLPSVAEQRKIVDTLDEALSEVDAIRRETVGQRQISDSLRQSILRAAFSGKLVPQDPADEPASALLARIAAERAKEAAAAKPRPRRR